MSARPTGIRRTSTELEFLPAHLELIERPVSRTARSLAGILCALLCIGMAWSYFGQIDIVASAPGRVVATSRSKTIQSMETALVRRVHVTDGDVVRAGAPLIDLDDTAAVADRIKAAEALAAAERMIRRQTLLLAALDRDAWGNEASAPDEPTRLAQLDHAQYVARKRALAAIAAQRRGEAATVKGQLAALAEAATISARRSTDTGKLIAAGHVARHEFLQREQERIEAGRVARAQVGHAAELDAAADAADRDLQTHVTTTRQQAADQLRESSESAAQFRQDLASAEQRIRQLHLVAPVDGTVQQLATHTVGGVVTPGQALLSIVPDGDPLEVEATVLNQDIGFVRPGQPVTVKIETFPYTRYGFVQGHVETVSHDATQDEKLGLVFPARVRLESSRLRIDGVDVSLSPGMAVTAEVKTGRRRLIDYLLGPLQEQLGEAARER